MFELLIFPFIYCVIPLCILNTLIYFIHKKRAFKLYFMPVLFPPIFIGYFMGWWISLIILFRDRDFISYQNAVIIAVFVFAYFMGQISLINRAYYYKYDKMYSASKKRKNVSYS